MKFCVVCLEAIEHRAVSLAEVGIESPGLAHHDCAKEALKQADGARRSADLAYLEGRA